MEPTLYIPRVRNRGFAERHWRPMFVPSVAWVQYYVVGAWAVLVSDLLCRWRRSTDWKGGARRANYSSNSTRSTSISSKIATVACELSDGKTRFQSSKHVSNSRMSSAFFIELSLFFFAPAAVLHSYDTKLFILTSLPRALLPPCPDWRPYDNKLEG